MKAKIQYVPAERIEELLANSGAKYEALAGFVKVHGPLGHNLYIAKTKRVGRCDVSGFIPQTTGINVLDEDLAFGNVGAQVDFTRPEDEVLNTLAELIDEMLALEPKAKVSRKSPKAKEGAAKGWSENVPSKQKADTQAA